MGKSRKWQFTAPTLTPSRKSSFIKEILTLVQRFSEIPHEGGLFWGSKFLQRDRLNNSSTSVKMDKIKLHPECKKNSITYWWISTILFVVALINTALLKKDFNTWNNEIRKAHVAEVLPRLVKICTVPPSGRLCRRKSDTSCIYRTPPPMNELTFKTLGYLMRCI